MMRASLLLLGLAALAACTHPVGDAALPSGISHTGSAGMTGGTTTSPMGTGMTAGPAAPGGGAKGQITTYP